jgi:DNA-binding MarR family transcriptional regulator
LVSRRRRTDDERAVDIRLTPAGRALREQASDIPACMAQRLQLSLEQMQRLRDELKRLTQHAQTPTIED